MVFLESQSTKIKFAYADTMYSDIHVLRDGRGV